jgi:WD40 repeat protein
MLDIEADNLQFAPNGRYVALWEGEDIRLWDIEVEDIVGTMPEHDGGVQSLSFSPNSERAISINSRGQARLWDIAADGAVRLRIWFTDSVDRVYMSPDSSSAAVARHDFMTRFFNVSQGQNRGNYDISPNAIFSPDWSIIATSSNNVITWHGLNATTREFYNRPFAFTSQVANVRPTPSTEFARVGVFPQDTPIFAVGKSEDGEWLLIWLPDGTQGWINVVTLRDIGRLSLLPTVEAESEGDEASNSGDE